MRNPPMMKCGHAANAILTRPNGDQVPSCVVCYGLVAGADEIDENPPSLEGREAMCSYCRNTNPSSVNLAFFEYLPNQKYDNFYDGCRGWD